MKKSYMVIGLGKFGTALAVRLCELGNEVLVLDTNAERVQKMESRVTCAVVGDARDEGVLVSLGVRDYECAVVAIGEDLASNIIVTMNLKQLGMKKVVCKATDEIQKKALEKVGADRVIVPERESGIKLAQNLTSSDVLDFIELAEDIGILEMRIPGTWVGKSLKQLNVRAKYNVNVIALRISEKLELSFTADQPLEENQVLVMLGKNEDLERLPQ